MTEPDDAITRAVAECLTRTQQMLLQRGYTYVDGDVAAWPLTFVEMQNRDSVLLVGPLGPHNCQVVARAWQTLASQVPAAGMLLVGVMPKEHPAVGWLFKNTRGATAYMDAARGQCEVRRPMAIWTEPPLPVHKVEVSKFVNPAMIDPAARAIDCRSRLVHDLQEVRTTQEFQDKAERLTGKPIVTYALMGICIALYAIMYAPNWLSDPTTATLLKWGALAGPLVAAGQWWRLISSAFIHIGPMHLAFNMMAFYYFGRPLEIYQGKWRLAFFFLFSALAGGVVVLLWSPMVATAGASGGLFGLMGAMLGMIVRRRKDFPPYVRQALKRWITSILVFNVAFLFMPGISGAAHVGGFIGGLAIGLVLSRSPIRPQAPSLLDWFGAAVLSAVLVAGTFLAIQRMPALPVANENPSPATAPQDDTANPTSEPDGQ